MVERILPTYPLHAVRRGQEMAEVENTLADLDLVPTVMPGIRQLIVAMGKCWEAGSRARNWTVQEVVEDLHTRRLLRRQAGEAV